MAEKGAPLGAPTAVKQSRPSWHKTMLYSGGAEALCFQPEEARRVDGRRGEGGRERKRERRGVQHMGNITGQDAMNMGRKGRTGDPGEWVRHVEIMQAKTQQMRLPREGFGYVG